MICCVLTLVENDAKTFEVEGPLLDKDELTLFGIYISCISSLVENGAQDFHYAALSFDAKTIATC